MAPLTQYPYNLSQSCLNFGPNRKSYSHTKVGTFATAAAFVAIAPVRDGMAEVEISEA
jgi:hypothetical protein